MKNGRGNLSTCNIFFLITNNSKYVQVLFFFGCIIPAVKRVIYFWRHFITVLNMKNSYIPPKLVNFKTISFYCIFTYAEYLSYIWSPLKQFLCFDVFYLYIIIRLHLKSVTCDFFVFVTWLQTRKKNRSSYT